MTAESQAALATRFARYSSLVEIGVGHRPGLAAELAPTAAVTATDIEPRAVPAAVDFVLDDITQPDLSVYRGADLVYARNLPPELQRPTRAVAQRVDAACAFTTLGGDPAIGPTRPEVIPGTTLYWTPTDGPVRGNRRAEGNRSYR